MCMNEASDPSISCGAGKARDFLGIGLASHDSGVALIEMSQDTGVNMICNKRRSVTEASVIAPTIPGRAWMHCSP
jgi:hypothetical protein